MVMTPQEQRCELHLGLSVVKAYERNMLDWCGDSSDHSHSWLRSPPTCHTHAHTHTHTHTYTHKTACT